MYQFSNSRKLRENFSATHQELDSCYPILLGKEIFVIFAMEM